MNPQRPNSSGNVCQFSCGSSQKYGVAVLAVIVCLMIVATLGGALVLDLKASWQDYREARLALQADWLVASAFDRVRHQLLINPDYQGETWTIDTGKLDGQTSAVVQITIIRPTEANQNTEAKVALQLSSKGHTQLVMTRRVPVELGGAVERSQTTPIPSATRRSPMAGEGGLP